MNNILTDEDTIYSSFQIVTELQIFTGEENDFFKICSMNSIHTEQLQILTELQILQMKKMIFFKFVL